MNERIHLTVEQARALAESAVAVMGYDEEDRRVIAEHFIDAALCGYEYSGLPKILNMAEAPQAWQPKTKPQIVFETPVSARMDGGNSVGMLAVARAAETAIVKAKSSGIALVSLGNSWISGRSAHYLEMVTRAGMVGWLTTSAIHKVAPYGGRKAALGTNPIAFGIPTDGDPLIFDMGTSAFMNSELLFFKRNGRSLPPDVALDAAGKATTDPSAVLAGGALLPFGGHKGYGLALVMHALGLLDGTDQEGDPWRSGYVLQVFQPDLLVPAGDYRRQVTAMLGRMRATPLREGASEVRIPSERSFRTRERLRVEGIEIDAHIARALEHLIARGGPPTANAPIAARVPGAALDETLRDKV